ncbi:DNA-binding transcriptional LysR family regulator [Alicyclobacillus sacchari]|uniref:DNA-binding transcriptional LysR family regulator n=1 Tax=Alicyclobacillus sacchari TaxID=392010 RepID=A0A4R8LTK5_9BACL|nr:LysR family transcriptional regulator [Alicyclobacillus sacchari]TDY50067.1 DNA-binding transcriptional LysR family regulator [Alicyclobacillus sacchari]GMA57590.1 putative HTH-type transcriptional regulator YusT [Alicyclobacillus sacchari]
MESNELRIFRIVAREGSITKAAQILGYVQSNVTARVQQLEAELHTQLFYRQRGMVLTPAGEKLLDYAERVVRLLDEAHQVLNDASEPTGRLKLGAHHTLSAIHLPMILAKYHKVYPNVELSLTTDYSDALAHKVRHFELDGAFVKSGFEDANIVQELVFEEQLVLISRPEKEDVQSVCNQPFLMNTIGCPHREQLEIWLKSIGIRSIRYLEFNHLDAIIQGVISGLGASFVPQSAIQKYEEKGLVRSFAVPAQYSSSKTYFIRHKDTLMTSALKEFTNMLQQNPLRSLPIQQYT